MLSLIAAKGGSGGGRGRGRGGSRGRRGGRGSGVGVRGGWPAGGRYAGGPASNPSSATKAWFSWSIACTVGVFCFAVVAFGCVQPCCFVVRFAAFGLL
ncbi:hypothetical protein Q3G72_009662 [Acer saccharum]|nr:hypothetical protein Q3G72_009662 [Acer saccharum]